MGYNPSVDYGQNAFRTNSAQSGIAGLQNNTQRAILGDSSAGDAQMLTQSMMALKALLGEIRVRAQEIITEMLESKKPNKDMVTSNIAVG